MKRATMFFISLIVLSSACGRRMIVQVPTAPKPSNASDKMSKEERRTAKVQKKLLEAKNHSGLTCKDQEGWDNVIVGLSSDLQHSYQSHVVIKILNPHPFPVQIGDERAGIVVADFCPEGVVSIGRRINIFRGDGNNLRVGWRAWAFVDGVLMTDESPRFYLNTRSYNRKRQNGFWEIQLKVSKGRSGRF